MTTPRKYRSRDLADKVVAFSISYQRDNLLERGLGFEHLRELLIRMARPILRNGASIAYAGTWAEVEDSFTYPLLRLVSAEQEDNSLGGPDSSLQIGKLYNHCSWPYYLDITPKIEAQWINSCRIVRITQEDAGLQCDEVVPDANARDETARNSFNAAVTLSAMRGLTMKGMQIDFPDVPNTERIPPIVARVLLGGKVDGYSGFLPGIFEEALQALRNSCPLYLLGGFGGASAILADAILNSGERPAVLTLAEHEKRNPALVRLLNSPFRLPDVTYSTKAQLDELFGFLQRAHLTPSQTLLTGLNDDETRELLTTRSATVALRLVRNGLNNKLGLRLL